MSQKKILVDLDLNGNQLKNVVAEVVTADPADLGTGGRFIYNSTTKDLKFSDGTKWIKAKCTATSMAADQANAQYAIYDSEVDSEFKFRAIATGTRTDGTRQLSITLANGIITIDATLKKEDVGLENVENAAQLRATQLSTDASLTSKPENDAEGAVEAQDGLVPSQKAVKTYVDKEISRIDSLIAGGVVYAGVWDGSKSIEANLTILGLATSDNPLRKGMLFKVSVAGTASGIVSPSKPDDGLMVGDQVIANKELTTGPASANAPDFDVIDNTESTDIVRVDAVQTITNKTINADNNTISNIETDNFKEGVIVSALNESNKDSETNLPNNKAITNKFAEYKSTVSDLKAEMYSQEVTTGNQVVIATGTHNCGTNPTVSVFQKSGANFMAVEADIQIADSGTVTVAWNGTINSASSIKVVITGVR